MAILRVEHLTKDYGRGNGVFDVSFDIAQGEVFGFLGPNGAGKTTTIRHLMGFIKPQRGSTYINGLDCWKYPKQTHQKIGYLPGEISFPADMTGTQLLKFLADMRGLKDTAKMKAILDMMDLDPSSDLKRMSKGMKQKMGIVCAFMHDPEFLILDEPTSGLDPLMQSVFIKLIHDEKQNGKSILMSSHMFEEVEGTCDRVGIIKQGKLVAVVDPKAIRHTQQKTFKVEFIDDDGYQAMSLEPFVIREKNPDSRQITLDIEDARINEFILALSKRRIRYISEVKHGLEEYFMGYYDGGKTGA